MTKLILSAVLAGLTLPALAQQPPVGGPPSPDPARMQRMQQREGDDLALVLGLRSAQRPALEAFLASGRPPAPPRDGARPGSPPGSGDAVPLGFDQQLTMDEARLAEHVRTERAHIAAARAFYGQLDAGQKQRFDALMRLRHGPGGPGEHGGGPAGPGPHGAGEGGPPPPPNA